MMILDAAKLVADHVQIFAAPTPDPGVPGLPTPKAINFSGIFTLLLEIAVPLLAILGLIFISRARSGEVSRVVTSSGIAMVGIGFLIGAAALLGFGPTIINTIFK